MNSPDAKAAELPPQYNPKDFEAEMARLWERGNFFHAEPGQGRPYSIVIPPPNVTAALHLGHALNNTLQDILIRWRRMQGRNTLWMPGTDHAGIATQTVVEKRILAEEGRHRTDFEREAFVARVQAWKDEYEATILGQLKAMGCSCDWARTRFTMDDVCAAAVRAAFFKLFADGLIYRGKRLVNWDPATQTVLADDEVEHETVQGHFWYLKYPLEHPVALRGTGILPVSPTGILPVESAVITHVTVATTRPETMLGDTAVAMNPADPRAAALVGQRVRLPIVGRLIPIIADEHVVLPDPESADEKARFSTGFLKVTPAHDPSDWDIAQRQTPPLAVVNVLGPDGAISDKHGWTDWEQVSKDNPELQNLIGLDRFEARESIVEWFRKENLLEDVKPYAHEVGHSYRSHVPIEPYLSDQWFIAVKKPIPSLCSTGISPPASSSHPSPLRERVAPMLSLHRGPGEGVVLIPGTDVPVNSLAGLALKPLLDGKLKFVPERYAQNYQRWLENLRDWPISRQLWWGHQIPVWSASSKEWQDGRITEEYDACLHLVHSLLAKYRDGIAVANSVVSDGSNSFGIPEDGVIRVCVRNSEEIEKRLAATGFTRDPDVLDTWFSSALWPISTMGWPEETDLLKFFYPTDLLCTAREIITLWVSRMVMFGQYFRGDVPFHTVYIHAMIQDGEGRKMSKSLGNGIDPLDIIETHGSDAMRFTLGYMTTETQDVRMPVVEMELPGKPGRRVNTSPKFDIGRNFCNKLWNAARFTFLNLQDMDSGCHGCRQNPSPLTGEGGPGVPGPGEGGPSAGAQQFDRSKMLLEDRWMLSRLTATVAEATRCLEEYRFHDYAETVYSFFWNDFCDWYLEITKPRMKDAATQAVPQRILAYALDQLLRLAHPISPYISEALWQHLNQLVADRSLDAAAPAPPAAACIVARWPEPVAAFHDPEAEKDFALVQATIRAIRNIRARMGIPPRATLTATIKADQDGVRRLRACAETIKHLAWVESLTADPQAARPPASASEVVGAVQVFVPLAGLIDLAGERARLQKQMAEKQEYRAGIEKKLANENFVARAKPEVVEAERARLAKAEAELAALRANLRDLE